MDSRSSRRIELGLSQLEKSLNTYPFHAPYNIEADLEREVF
jgi:hypothetical protein